MKRTILIYELVPEETRVYDLQVTEEELAKLRLCHNRISGNVNTSDETEDMLEWLSEFLRQQEPVDLETFTAINTQCEFIFTGFML